MEPQKINPLEAMPGRFSSKKINKKKMIAAKNNSHNYESKTGTYEAKIWEWKRSAPCPGYARRSFFLWGENNWV
jgi:hypothetical protein